MSGVREICFDTETTGFEAWGDDRITEIGAIELIDLLPTGRSFHCYCHPGDKEISEKVTKITGIDIALLEREGAKDFSENADAFLAFIGDSPLIAHNAEFDRNFINAELERAGYSRLSSRRFIDTLKIARAKFPGSPASLDALCKRFNISLAARDTHGAIIDSELLASVYLELKGGRAHVMDFGEAKSDATISARPKAEQRGKPLSFEIPIEEIKAHDEMIKTIGEGAIWHKFA